MDITDKIKSLKATDLNCNVFDVYSYDGLSMQELLCQFFTKINECIKISNETIDLTSWLVNEGLEQEVVEKLMSLLNDGTVENLINDDLFNTLNTKIQNINSQLTQKVNTIDMNSKIWSMANMGQDVKEAMTGGSVAVVGRNTILNENIINNQISPSKLNCAKIGKNKFDKKASKFGCYYQGSTGNIIPGTSEVGLNVITELISVNPGETYYRNKTSNVIYFDSSFNRLGNEIVDKGAFTIIENCCYIGLSFRESDIDDFQIELGNTSTKYEEFTFSLDGFGLKDGSWGTVFVSSTGSINFNFVTNILEIRIPTTMYLHYLDKVDKFDSGDIEIPLTLPDGISNGVIMYDYINKTFISQSVAHADKKNKVIIAFFSRARKSAILLGEYTVNGHLVNSKGEPITPKAPLDNIFLRYGNYHYKATVNGTDINLETTATMLYWVYKDNKNHSLVLPPEFQNFTLKNNECLVLDLDSKTLRIHRFGSANVLDYEKDVVLLLNISGNLSGHLHYNIIEHQHKYINPSNSQTIMSGRELLFKSKIEFSSSYLSDFTFIDDELWAFAVSNDAHTNTAPVNRYTIDYENKSLNLMGTFTHNFGHANTVDYCSQTDCLIMGNGGGSNNTEPNEFYIFPNAKDFKNQSNVVLNEKAIKYDVNTLDWGKQVNVFWGESNGGKYNIAYAISNDGSSKRFIRKLLLGQGANQLENGAFIEGKSGLEFNGTFKVLDTWTRDWHRYEFNNGTDWHDGVIYESYGDGALWYGEHSLLNNNKIATRTIRELLYDYNGDILSIEPEGMAIKNSYMHIGDSKNNIYIYKF